MRLGLQHSTEYTVGSDGSNEQNTGFLYLQTVRLSHVAVRPVEHPPPRPAPDVLELEAGRRVEPPPGVGVGIGEDNHLHLE